MNVQEQYGAVLAALGTCRGAERWDHMRVLADAAADSGDTALAAGWRWLAEHRKWPAYRQRRQGDALTWGWGWSAAKRDWRANTESRLPYSLAELMAGVWPMLVDGPITITGPDLPHLMGDTARAVGRWLGVEWAERAKCSTGGESGGGSVGDPCGDDWDLAAVVASWEYDADEDDDD